MKELSIEEKAQRYDETLPQLKGLLDGIHEEKCDIIEEDIIKIFPELKESEDERIRKELIFYLRYQHSISENFEDIGKWIAWLEKQGKKTKPIEGFNTEFERQVSCLIASAMNRDYEYTKDFVKWTSDALLNYAKLEIEKNSMGISEATKKKLEDNLNKALEKETPESWNKFLEKQGEQKTADNEPKFKVGDWVFIEEVKGYKNGPFQIKAVDSFGYNFDEYHIIPFMYEDLLSKWTIQDAKDGDVLTCYSDIKGQPIEQTGIIKQYVGRHGGCSNSFKAHFGVDWDNNVVIEGYMGSSNIYPATKKQRDTLMKAMADAGYTFDFEKKELKKIEEEVNGEDYGIDSLYHAQIILEKTLGSVDGYQSDDGILEHKCAISAVKKLYEKKSWSEEDETRLTNIIIMFKEGASLHFAKDDITKAVDWLKSLKPHNKWKPSKEQMEALKLSCGGNYVNLGILESLYNDLKKLKG